MMSDGTKIEFGEFGFAIDGAYPGSDTGIERAAMAKSGNLAHWGDTLEGAAVWPIRPHR